MLGLLSLINLAAFQVIPPKSACPRLVNKLVLQDESPNAYLGRSVALIGDQVLAGAFQDSETTAGLAFIFDIQTGVQTGQLIPNGDPNPIGFGGNFAIDEGIIVTTSVGSDANGKNSGAAFLFDAETGEQVAKLLPDVGARGDWFGSSIAIGDGLVTVGSIYDDDNGSQSGSVSIFDVQNGSQLAKFLPDDGHPGDTFGEMVAIENGILLVSAQLDGDQGFRSGSAYLFDLTYGNQLHKLIAADGQPEDRFGYSLDMRDGLIAIGAYRDDDNGENSGSVYIFDASTGKQIAKINPDDGAPGDTFGFRVSIHNGLLAATAVRDDDSGPYSGSTYLFDARTGEQLAKVTAPDAAADDHFGRSVDLNSHYLAVGAWQDDDRGPDSGAVYVFDVSCLSAGEPAGPNSE